MRGPSSLSGAAIWRTGRVVVTTLTVLTNMAGTATVLLITFFVVPIPPGSQNLLPT